VAPSPDVPGSYGSSIVALGRPRTCYGERCHATRRLAALTGAPRLV